MRNLRDKYCQANCFDNMVLDQSARIDRCIAHKNDNLIMDWINDINDDIKKSTSLINRLSFDRWMRNIKNIYYSDHERMNRAYQKIDNNN